MLTPVQKLVSLSGVLWPARKDEGKVTHPELVKEKKKGSNTFKFIFRYLCWLEKGNGMEFIHFCS